MVREDDHVCEGVCGGVGVCMWLCLQSLNWLKYGGEGSGNGKVLPCFSSPELIFHATAKTNRRPTLIWFCGKKPIDSV